MTRGPLRLAHASRLATKEAGDHEPGVQPKCNCSAKQPGSGKDLTMDVVASWTGERADALRRALRMTNESFAEYLGVAVRTVAYWRDRADIVPRPAMQEILDTALARAPESARAQFHLILSERGQEHAITVATKGAAPLDAASLTSWITASNTNNAAIERIDQTMTSLANRHTLTPARDVLGDVLRLHGKAHLLLRSGRQRLNQTRDLLRLNGSMLAHASVLLGDLGKEQAAEDYGHTAQLYLQEADASQSTAWYALAKAARWQHQYAAAADFARRGFEDGPITTMSVQLASYEANAAALLGDNARAREALSRAETFAAVLSSNAPGTSPWSFPADRQAIFKLSVLLRSGDATGALRAAAEAEQRWAAGEPPITGTWAQIQIGAAIAHLLQGSLDGAADQIAPVLMLAPQFRIATVTGWLHDLDVQLARPGFASSPIAASLRQQIHDFIKDALPRAGQEDQ